MPKYLDYAGTEYLVNKIDELYVRKADGKVLSSNDFTDEYKQMIDDLAYVKIAVNSMSATNSSNEIGATVSASNVTWTLNKEPKTQKIQFGSDAEETLGTDVRSKAYSGKSVTSNTSIKLTVTDDRDAVVTKNGYDPVPAKSILGRFHEDKFGKCGYFRTCIQCLSRKSRKNIFCECW